MRRPSALVAALVLLAGCGSAQAPDSAALGRQILDAEAAEAAAWAARDVDAIMNAYAPDAIVLLGGTPAPDRGELRRLFEDFLGDPGFTLTFRSDPPLVAGSGDLGVAVGTYELTYTDPATQAIGRRSGRHLINWQLQPDGAWRIVRQMTVNDSPPRAQ